MVVGKLLTYSITIQLITIPQESVQSYQAWSQLGPQLGPLLSAVSRPPWTHTQLTAPVSPCRSIRDGTH